jgi:hypothetical protein
LENHKNKDNNNTEYNEYDDNIDRNDDNIDRNDNNTDRNDENTDDSNDENTNNKKYSSKKNRLNKLKINEVNQLKKKQRSEKIKLINYKKQLDKEKEKILSIIDELSNINDYENTKSKPYPNYLGQDINNHYGTNYSNTQRFFNQSTDNLPKLPHNLADNSQYYDINKNLDDDTNKIDGLYIEPPFN